MSQRRESGGTRKLEMSWKKNALSYLMWLVYTVLTGVILLGVCGTLCAQYWIPSYWAIPMVVLYAVVVCGFVVLLHRFSAGFAVMAGRKREQLLILEALAAIAFLAAGIILRINGMAAVTQSSDYFEMAKVVEGQEIPQTVHGAVYFYVRILHIVFILMGNHFMAGIWAQTVLQLAASVIFYFTVRRLSGSVAALVVFGFCMCAPYMVYNSLVLSPEALYFFLISIAVSLMTMRISVNRLRPVVFLCMGILSAFCFYIDIAGVLLLLLAAGIAFSRREKEQDRIKRILAVVFCLMGTVLGFACCIFLDSYFSGKTIQGVALAWLRLYQAQEFSLPVIVGMRWIPLENAMLAGLMVFGIFSFWCDKKGEKISLYTLMACGVIAACSFGIFAKEMSGFYCLYLIFAVLAGTGVGQCFHAVYADRSAGEVAEEEKTEEAVDEKREEEPIILIDLSEPEERKPVQYLENPLPLPKKHVKRKMDYSLQAVNGKDDFDYPVADDDDFDI